MKKFLVRFLVWLSVPLAMAFATDYMISSGLRKTDLRKYAAWNDIYRGNLHPDLVAVGSSRVWMGYNTYILDSMLNCDSYNLGFNGHYIDFQIIRYETFRRLNTKPKVVLMNTDFMSTFGITADSEYEREQFFPYFFDDTLIQQVAETKKITWIDRHVPLVRYFGYRDEFEWGIESFFGRTKFFDGGMHKGYRGEDRVFDRGVLLSKDTVLTAWADEKAVRMLDEFTNKAVKEDVKVVFVKSPVYRPLTEKFGNVNEIDSIFENISKKYSVPVLDYYDTTICFDSTNFESPGHLNKKGSEVFTMQLCHDLDSLGILNN